MIAREGLCKARGATKKITRITMGAVDGEVSMMKMMTAVTRLMRVISREKRIMTKRVMMRITMKMKERTTKQVGATKMRRTMITSMEINMMAGSLTRGVAHQEKDLAA
jgi:hypothetical protein